MKEHAQMKALLYRRVSSAKQTTRGDGLSSQETRCREYAKYKGYEVVQVFKDDMSGSLLQRPGMQAMRSFLRNHRRQPHVVIIDDISRLARGWRRTCSCALPSARRAASWNPRRLNSAKTRTRCWWKIYSPASLSINARRTASRPETACGRGCKTAIGSSRPRSATASNAPPVRGKYWCAMNRFLESHPEYPRDRKGVVRNQPVTDMLKQVVYAGYVEAGLRRGQHEPLISYETFRKIEQRLKGNAKVPARKNLNQGFPLRGFVTCGHCGMPLTACWSKGRHARYSLLPVPREELRELRKVDPARGQAGRGA
jgi:hypothetical protein